MQFCKVLLSIYIITITSLAVVGVELTFELSNNRKQCFYENIPLNTTPTLQFQVISGGQYDLDVTLEAPNMEIIYKQIKTQFDTYTFTPKIPGIHVVCFSNKFSTFSHKMIYMNFLVKGGQNSSSPQQHITLMSQMEASTQEISKYLSTVQNYQTHHRLKEAKGRKRAEELNEQVLWWSVLEIIFILISAIGQVFIVMKDFALEKKTIQMK